MSASSTSGGVGGCSGSGSGGGAAVGPCGACKFLRRKCVAECIFAPYFDSEQGATHFAAVHKVFGASNVSKLLLHIPVHKRLDAVVTICYEAQARLRDPVYGCVANIFALQQQVVNLQAELSYLQTYLASLELPTQPPALPPPMLTTPPPLSIADLPSASTMPANFDLSTLFDPLMQQSWALQQRQMDFRQYGAGRNPTDNPLSTGEDLQALARELLQRQGTTAGTTHQPATSAAPPPPPLSG